MDAADTYFEINVTTPGPAWVCGDAPSSEYLHSPYRWFIKCLRSRSKTNPKKYVNLTAEDLKLLFEKQQGTCPITGWKLKLPLTTNGWKNNKRPENASVDRINSSEGYTKDNVRFVSYIANIARNTYSDDTLIDFCRAVTEYTKSLKKVKK